MWQPLGSSRWIGGLVTAPTQAGPYVNEELSLTLPAVFRAVDSLSSHLAMLPLIVYRYRETGRRERDDSHRLYNILNISPNEWMTAMEYRKTIIAHRLLWGYSISIKTFSVDGQSVTALDPVWPGFVTTKRTESGSVVHVLSETGAVKRELPDSMVFIHRGLSSDGITVFPPIRMLARENIGLSMAIEQYAQSYFGNGTRFGTVFVSPPNWKQPERDAFLETVRSKHGGPGNAWRELAAPHGMEIKETGQSNVDSQTLELMQYSVADVARWFNMPPHMLAELSKATFSNITEQALEYVKYTILPLAKELETAMTFRLLSESERKSIFIEHVLEGLLQGDPKTRAEFYTKMIFAGVMTINEARRRENLNDIGESGDQHFVPTNMTTADRMMSGVSIESAQPNITTMDDQTEEEQDEPNEAQARAAMIRVLADAASAVGRKECKAIRAANNRLGRDRAKMVEWADDFYSRLGPEMSRMFIPAAEALAMLLGVDVELSRDAIAALVGDFASSTCHERREWIVSSSVGPEAACERIERTYSAIASVEIADRVCRLERPGNNGKNRAA